MTKGKPLVLAGLATACHTRRMVGYQPPQAVQTRPLGHHLGQSILVASKRLELGFSAGAWYTLAGKLGGGAGRMSYGKCRVQILELQRRSRIMKTPLFVAGFWAL